MPDFFLDVTGNIGRKPNFDFFGLPLEGTQARPNELLEAEILGDFRGILCLVKHLDPVKDQYPDIVSYMGVIDNIKGLVEGPDSV